MKKIKYLIFVVLLIITNTNKGLGQNQCKIDGDNNGVVAQFNNSGNAYLTLIVFDVTKDQLIISIGENLKITDNLSVSEEFKKKEDDFKPLPIKSPEAIKQLDKAKNIILPAMANSKTTVCFEDLINDAVENGKIQVQQVDSSYTRLVIGDAERLLGDFVIYYESQSGIQRVKENGKYYYIIGGECAFRSNNLCKYFDYATDFYGDLALIGYKLNSYTFEYFIIDKNGKIYNNNVYVSFKEFNLGNVKYLLINDKDKKQILLNEKGITQPYDAISSITISNSTFLIIHQNGHIGIAELNLNYDKERFEIIKPDTIQQIGEIYPYPFERTSFRYESEALVNVKVNNAWNLTQMSFGINYSYRREFLFQNLLENYPNQIIILPNNKENSELIKIKSGVKVGLINTKNRKILPPIYDEITDFDKFGYAKIRKEKTYQYIDRSLNIASVEYNSIAQTESGELAIFENNKKKGLLQISTKEIIIEADFDTIIVQKNRSYVKVKKNGYFGLLGISNKVNLDAIYDDIRMFDHTKYVEVKKNGLLGIVNIGTGSINILPKYDKLIEFCDLKFVFEKDGRWGIVKPDGQETFLNSKKEKFEINNIKPSSSYKIAIVFGYEKYSGVINSDGQYICKGQFKEYVATDSKFYDNKELDNNLVWVYLSEINKIFFINNSKLIATVSNYQSTISQSIAFSKYKLIKTDDNGYLNFNGEAVVQGGNTEIEDFNDLGFVWAKDSTSYFSLYNHKGKKITKRPYDDHGRMNKEMIISVKRNDNWGYIKIDNNEEIELIRCKYYIVNEFNGDFAIVYQDIRWGIIGKNDYLYVPFIFSEIEFRDDKFIARYYHQNEPIYFELAPSLDNNLKRFRCVSGNCELYEQSIKSFYEKRD